MVVQKVLAYALMLFAATPSPVPAVPGGPAGDHVYILAGTWTCRTVEGVIVRAGGTRAGDTLTVRNDVERGGKHDSFDDLYVFDPALRRWHVQSALGGFGGEASPWTGDSWVVQGQKRDGVDVRMTDELLPGGDFRRTFAYDDKSPSWHPFNVERCTRGSTPPSPDACIAKRYPATTLETVKTELTAPPNSPSGTVQVAVSLDTSSRVVGARILSSPAPELNLAALAEARRTKFRTEIVDCKPIAADYVFSVSFGE
jgi:hypothetical protein